MHPGEVEQEVSGAAVAIVASGMRQCITEGDGPGAVDVAKMEKLFLALA